MLSKLNAPKELIVGLIYAIGGAVLFFWAQDYEIGSATEMGPGYFPSMLGVLLVLFGIANLVKAAYARTPDPISEHRVGPLISIVLAVVSFGLLIDRAGLFMATFVCLFFACFNRLRTHPLEVLLLFAALMLFNYLVFIRIFELNMPMFWWN